MLVLRFPFGFFVALVCDPFRLMPMCFAFVSAGAQVLSIAGCARRICSLRSSSRSRLHQTFHLLFQQRSMLVSVRAAPHVRIKQSFAVAFTFASILVLQTGFALQQVTNPPVDGHLAQFRRLHHRHVVRQLHFFCLMRVSRHCSSLHVRAPSGLLPSHVSQPMIPAKQTISQGVPVLRYSLHRLTRHAHRDTHFVILFCLQTLDVVLYHGRINCQGPFVELVVKGPFRVPPRSLSSTRPLATVESPPPLFPSSPKV